MSQDNMTSEGKVLKDKNQRKYVLVKTTIVRKKYLVNKKIINFVIVN